MSRIVLTTAGSLGDLHPYLAVGIGLKSRGHEVTIATAEFYRANVIAESLQFAPLRGALCSATATVESIRQSCDPKTGVRFLLTERILPYIEEIYEDLVSICDGIDVLVSHPAIFAAPLVAEKLGIKWISGVLSPLTFLSAYDPPVLAPAPWLHALRVFAPLPYKVMRVRPKARGGKLVELIASLRQTEGLQPSSTSDLHRDMFSPHGTLALFSSVLAKPQKDWPTRTCVTGFPMYDQIPGEETLDSELHAFLASGDLPVIFTLGSAAVVDAGDFYEQSAAAVGKLGCRAVLLVGKEVKKYGALRSRDIFVTSYVRYAEIFPKAAVVVHQGGIGTVAQVLQASVPSLVAPLGFDQPDNANRLKRIGAARLLPRRRYNAERLSVHLRKLLHEPKWRDAARRNGELVRLEDGVSRACIAIEQVCFEGSL